MHNKEKIMKIGKVPENILKRSVINRLEAKRPEVILGSAVGEDCAAIELAEDEIVVLSTDPITGTAKDIGELAVIVTVNDLASAGAEPIGILLTVLLPPDTQEEVLRGIMTQVNAACERNSLQVVGGHTEVTPVVTVPVVSVTGVAKVKKGKLLSTGGARVGMDLVATKWIAIEGTSIIAKEKEEELVKLFPKEFVETAKGFDRFLSVLPDSRIALSHGVAAMHDVTEGGIFGALWEMCESSGVGMEVNVSDIPVRQETIEICEHFGINPYELVSSGCMLIATEDGKGLVAKLNAEGIGGAVIGKTKQGNDRIIHMDGVDRYLEPPKADALYQVI